MAERFAGYVNHCGLNRLLGVSGERADTQVTQASHTHTYTYTLYSPPLPQNLPMADAAAPTSPSQGGRNTIVMHNTCEDSLLAAPIILDMVLLAEMATRIEFRVDGEDFHGFHPVCALLSYLSKAPLVPPGACVVPHHAAREHGGYCTCTEWGASQKQHRSVERCREVSTLCLC